MFQSFKYLGKFLKVTKPLFSKQCGQKFVFFHFQRVLLLNCRQQVNVIKITNDEVSKNASGHHKIIGELARSTNYL